MSCRVCTNRSFIVLMSLEKKPIVIVLVIRGVDGTGRGHVRPAHFANVWRPGPFRCDPDYRGAVGTGCRRIKSRRSSRAMIVRGDLVAARDPAVSFTSRRTAPRAMGLKDNGSFVGVAGTAGWTRTTGLLIHSQAL